MNDKFLAIIITICLIVGIFIILPNEIVRSQCKAKAIKQELQYDYSIMQGCMVKYNGKWIDYDRLRYTEE